MLTPPRKRASHQFVRGQPFVAAFAKFCSSDRRSRSCVAKNCNTSHARCELAFMRPRNRRAVQPKQEKEKHVYDIDRALPRGSSILCLGLTPGPNLPRNHETWSPRPQVSRGGRNSGPVDEGATGPVLTAHATCVRDNSDMHPIVGIIVAVRQSHNRTIPVVINGVADASDQPSQAVGHQ